MYHASNDTSKTKGVAILISKNCPLKITESKHDLNGRYIFLKGTLHNRPITLANLYAPNKKQVTFFRETLQLLTEFYAGILVVGGDFNVALNPQQDSSTGATSLPYRALRAIKKQLQELTLHDTWRTLDPNDRDYTFYSSPHSKYSRINHFFISQNDLPRVKQVTIDPMILSDHNPISMTLTFSQSQHTHSIW